VRVELALVILRPQDLRGRNRNPRPASPGSTTEVEIGLRFLAFSFGLRFRLSPSALRRMVPSAHFQLRSAIESPVLLLNRLRLAPAPPLRRLLRFESRFPSFADLSGYAFDLPSAFAVCAPLAAPSRRPPTSIGYRAINPLVRVSASVDSRRLLSSGVSADQLPTSDFHRLSFTGWAVDLTPDFRPVLDLRRFL